MYTVHVIKETRPLHIQHLLKNTGQYTNLLFPKIKSFIKKRPKVKQPWMTQALLKSCKKKSLLNKKNTLKIEGRRTSLASLSTEIISRKYEKLLSDTII